MKGAFSESVTALIIFGARLAATESVRITLLLRKSFSLHLFYSYGLGRQISTVYSLGRALGQPHAEQLSAATAALRRGWKL